MENGTTSTILNLGEKGRQSLRDASRKLRWKFTVSLSRALGYYNCSKLK